MKSTTTVEVPLLDNGGRDEVDFGGFTRLVANAEDLAKLAALRAKVQEDSRRSVKATI